MISSRTSISKTDKADLAWFAQNFELTLPEVIPNKEVFAYVGSLLPDIVQLKPYIKTATDVLRLAVGMSGGDVSLAENTKFRSFTRRERKTLLSFLEYCGNRTEDMLRWKGRWVRLGERLHPGEYQLLYPKAAESFDVLRNSLPVATFNSRVEAALKNRNIHEAIDLLRDRAGEFARRLDHLLRLDPSAAIVTQFGEVAYGTATPVLLQTLTHFKHRASQHDLRIFFPKGDVAKVMAIDYNLPELPLNICEQVVEVCEAALTERFSKLSPLGRVYIDEALKEYIVPFSQRSASRSLRTLARGSRVRFPESGETIRFFLWWKEGDVNGKPTGRVDLDLSAVMHDSNWLYKEHIAYTNLRSSKYRACHSGDITSAPAGACEFIDIDIPSVLIYGGRYVVMSVHSFTGQKFLALPECRAGWMMRKHPDSGEVFEPQTVADKIDVASESAICMPVILDLLKRRAVWADVGLKRNPRHVTNVEGNSAQMTLIGKSITESVKPDLYSLFRLHADARGKVVESETDADTIFSLEKGVTPYDIETIAAEFI